MSDSPIQIDVDEDETIEAPSKITDRPTIDLVRSFFNLYATEKHIEGKQAEKRVLADFLKNRFHLYPQRNCYRHGSFNAIQ